MLGSRPRLSCSILLGKAHGIDSMETPELCNQWALFTLRLVKEGLGREVGLGAARSILAGYAISTATPNVEK
jgi:hypothetical protein